MATHRPDASQVSPSGQVPPAQLGTQNVLGSPVQVQSRISLTHTSPGAQSVSEAQSFEGSRQTPHPGDAPGGRQMGAPSQSVTERHAGPLGSVAPAQRSMCGTQIASQRGSIAVTVRAVGSQAYDVQHPRPSLHCVKVEGSQASPAWPPPVRNASQLRQTGETPPSHDGQAVRTWRPAAASQLAERTHAQPLPASVQLSENTHRSPSDPEASALSQLVHTNGSPASIGGLPLSGELPEWLLVQAPSASAATRRRGRGCVMVCQREVTPARVATPMPADREPGERTRRLDRAPSRAIWRASHFSGGIGMSAGWVQRSPHWASVLETFERYEVRGRLGAGGMAEIFLAQESSPPHRTIVLKRLLASHAAEPEMRAMFVDEARLGMRLTHPSLCRVHDVGMVGGDLVIAMEHVDGITLADLIDRSPRGLPVPVALSVVAEVAGALDSVHRARDEHGRRLGIVHRDVTPRNVMIAFDGRVKLLDFGLAKSALNESITRPGMAKGKFAYLAPELWSEAKPDARADIFSLGVCLFEALTGTRLYHRSAPLLSRDAIVDGPVPSIREHLPGAPEALDHVVRRCLAKQPAARFESAGSLRTALLELAAALGYPQDDGAVEALVRERFADEIARGPVVTPAPFAFERDAQEDGEPTQPTLRLEACRPRSSQRMWMAAGAAAVLAIGIALGGTLGRAGGSEPEPDMPRSFAAAPPEPGPTLAEVQSAEAVVPEPAVHVAAPAPAEPEPTAAPAARPRFVAPVARGALSVNTRPWSEVWVDGRSIGMTPIAELSVEAGSHELTFVDRDGNVHHATIEVPAGGVARYFQRLDPPATERADASDVRVADET